MHTRVKAIAWLLGLQATVGIFVIGAAIAGIAAEWGGSGAWGALLVACAALGAVLLTLTRGAIVHDGWPYERPLSKLAVVASTLSGVIALVATYLMIDLLLAFTFEDGWLWLLMGPLGTGAAWVAFFGWLSDRRLLAASGHLLSLFAPWGYSYPLQLIAIALALAAGASFRSHKVSSGAV